MLNDFKFELDKTLVEYRPGIFESFLLAGDNVYAIIRDNSRYPYIEEELNTPHGNALFNCGDGQDPSKLSILELCVMTDILPTEISGNHINNFLNKSCLVRLKEGIATFAYKTTDLNGQISTIPRDVLTSARRTTLEKSLSSDKSKNLLKENYLSEEDIQTIEEFPKYEEDIYKNKLITFQGEAVWTKDNSKQKDKEVVIPSKFASIIKGLNKLGMKSLDCHKPATFIGA